MSRKIFHVKSIPSNWDKEFKGLKPNTVRFTDDWDQKKWDDWYSAECIMVENSVTGKYFGREITDKTQFRNLAITSWRHKNGV